MVTHRAPAKIVGQHDDDVRFLFRLGWRDQRKNNDRDEQESIHFFAFRFLATGLYVAPLSGGID